MDIGALHDYYVALLSVQMVILGFVIAGIVALMQILNAAKPRRETRLLIKRRILALYLAYLAGLLAVQGAAAWSMAFQWQPGIDVFSRRSVGAVVLAACLFGLFGFVYLTYRARRLLEADEYLQKYVGSVPATRIRNYLFRIYSSRPVDYEPDLDETDRSERAKQKATQKQARTQVAAWDRRYAKYQNLVDPFQPIREYIKDNAFKYYDTGTAKGLILFAELYDKAFAAINRKPDSDEYYFLARFAAENSLEFFAIFRKTSSEKRRADTIRFAVARGQQFIASAQSEGLLTIVQALTQIAELADDDQEVMLCIEGIQQLTDAYLAKHKSDSWQQAGDTFEQICLAVTRLAEHYYLQRENQLQTLPISSQTTGEYRTVTSMLVDFFARHQQLADQYKDAYPVRYFEAIEAVLEALLTRYAEIVQNGRAARGLNSQYQMLIQKLYDIYRAFGLDAIEHNKPELLALCLSNLRRIIKPAKQLDLRYEQSQLVNAMVELAIRGVTELGDAVIKSNDRTISVYSLQTLQKHATAELVAVAIQEATKQPGIDLRRKEVKPFLAQLRAIQ